MNVNIQNKKGDSSNRIFPEAMKILKLLFTGKSGLLRPDISVVTYVSHKECWSEN